MRETGQDCSQRSGKIWDADAAATGFAASGDLCIYYEVHGEGEPVVLVHGWSLNTSSGWGDPGWIEALAEERQVVSVDVRGHGNSDKPYDQGLYGYEAMAGDVLAVMDELGIERADYVGYSLGAFSGVHLLGHNSDRFRSAVLMGIGDETDESAAGGELVAAALRAEDPSLLGPEDLFWRSAAAADPRNDLEALAVSALQMWPEGYPLELGGPALSELAIPVLVLNGALDIPYVLTDDNLVAAMPNATLTELSDADHYAVLTDPRFKAEVVEFLRQATE